MKILFISDTGLSLGLAMRCEAEGHAVSYYDRLNCGEGLIKPSESTYKDADLIVIDSNTFAAKADSLREEGHRVLGPSRWSSMLASDRGYQANIIASLGLPTNGVHQGTNLYLTAWFNGQNIIATYASIVYRRFMPGGAGPDLACTGMLSSFRGIQAKTQKTLIDPLIPMLRRVNHRGPVHIHALINGDSFRVECINADFMHPLGLLLYENTFLSASTILLQLFDETSKPIATADPWACGLQLSVSPFPHGQLQEDIKISANGLVPGNLKHLWLANVSKKDGNYYAHGAGLVGYVTARGANADQNYHTFECIRRMYRTISNLKVPDLQYRNDVGRHTNNLLHCLRQPGWLE